MRALLLSVAACAALAGAVQAHEVKAGDLILGDLAVRASLGAVPTSAGYLTITNRGDKPDRLLSVDCSCGLASVHRTQTRNGVTSMDAAGPVTIPAHGQVTFAPTGLHIMIMGLKAPLKAGQMQRMTLVFEHAGKVGAGFHVRDVIGATEDKGMAGMPGMANMPGMKH